MDQADGLMVNDDMSMPDQEQTGEGMMAGGRFSLILAAVYLHPLDQLMARLKEFESICSIL